MKYKAIIETDDFENFEFFEDKNGKYLHAVDANATNGEWIYLPFKALEQEPILDKIRTELLNNVYETDIYAYHYLIPKNLIDSVINKYKEESEG